MSIIENLYAQFLAHPKATTDTRKDLKNSIFFCLRGPNFDANTFAKKALEHGAAHVVSDDKANEGIAGITVVDDVLSTLQKLSAHHRQKLQCPVIGLTGSNGKTTNKELITAVLSTKYRTYSTAGNLNNHIGVPLTLLGIPSDAEMAVVEMGANHQGEIRDLCAISQPDYGMITNIGKAHLEGFGGIEGVKKGKKELFDSIRQNGKKVFVNADDPILMELSKGMDRVLFGKNADEYYVSGTMISATPFISFRFQAADTDFTEVNTHLVGSYNLNNLLAAACIGTWFDVPADKIREALGGYHPSNNRSQYLRTDKNDIILDAYNANPSSMEAALDNLAGQTHPQKMAFLGQMLELGETSREEHQRIIDKASALKIEAAFVGEGYKNCALRGNPYFETSEALVAYLKKNQPSGMLILVKGSRMVAMEKVIEYL